MKFHPILSRGRLVIAGAALVYGWFICQIFPGAVTTLGDDFGYYKSVIETIQHMRPWTDAWLEPWGASLCTISAIVFKATGSFLVAIQGVQAVLAGVAFCLVCLLLRERGHTPARAILAAALFLTFPTLLWKTLEYTSITIYLPCLLAALWAAGRQKWGWFFLAWILAVAARQSALTWLIIPGWELAGRLVKRAKHPAGAWRTPVFVLVGGMIFFGIMTVFMNKTHAQTVITDSAFAQIDPRHMAGNFLSGLLVFLTAAGAGAFLLRLPAGGREPRKWRMIAGLALICLTVLILRKYDPRDLVAVEHAGFQGRAGWYYAAILLAVAITGWTGGGQVFQRRMAVYALGNLALVSIRKDLLWDYYLIDVLIFGFFSLGVARTDDPMPVASRRLSPRLIACTALLFVAGFQGVAVLRFKERLDRTRAVNTLFERAFREGSIDPSALYGASFGFVGWHLQPYFMAHEGRYDPHIAGFWNYLKYAVDIRTKYLGWLGTVAPFKDEYPADSSRLILRTTRHVWWFFQAEYTIEHCTPLPPMPTFVKLKPAEYQRIPFPLNDAEWRELLTARAL